MAGQTDGKCNRHSTLDLEDFVIVFAEMECKFSSWMLGKPLGNHSILCQLDLQMKRFPYVARICPLIKDISRTNHANKYCKKSTFLV